MLLLTLMALLVAQDPAPPPADGNVVAPLVIEGKKTSEVPTRLEITDGLNDLLKTDPDRMICLERKPLYSRIPRMQCGTLRAWYRFQTRSGVFEGAKNPEPPTELVAAVQDQYMRKAMQIRAEKEAAAAAGKR